MAQASGGRVWWPSCGEADGENTDQPKSYAQLAIEQDAKVHASREHGRERHGEKATARAATRAATRARREAEHDSTTRLMRTVATRHT